MSVSDPSGRYAIKTDWQPSTVIVSAPGYVTKSFAVSDSQQFPVVNIDLDRAFAAAGDPTAAEASSSIVPVSAGSSLDAGTAAKLRQLQDLHDRGTISDEEYRRTRKRILEGL